jgi:hypothetical protein
VIWAVLIVLAAVAAVAGGIGFLLKQEPGYYTAAEVKAQPTDEAVAAEVITRYSDLRGDIMTKPDWAGVFTAAEVNAFFREYLDDGGDLADSMPKGLHNPRVWVEGDRVKFAARYGEGFWSTICSIELRAWLVNKQPNTVAVELCGVYAGSLPIESQVLMDWVTDKAREQNTEVTWYRHDGHPVGLFRIVANDPSPSKQIRMVKIGEGKLAVAGRSLLDMRLPSR